ncbi:MAG: hypothetical protein RL760_1041 [Candidatus Eisenbacteria bacterium]
MRHESFARLALLCAALLLSAPRAHAAVGMALRWDRCAGDAGVVNKNFACDVNTGSETLVGSFMLSRPSPSTSGLEIVLTLASASPTMPAWWAFRNAGTCRTSALTMGFNAPTGSVNCVDWDPTNSMAGGIGAYQFPSAVGPNTSRIVAVVAVPQSALADLVTDQEYFAFRFGINHTKTVGTGACGGCEVPVCLLLQKIDVITPTSHQALSTWWMSPDDLYATWQGGAGVSTSLGSGCPAATPTRNATWGAIKTLYR